MWWCVQIGVKEEGRELERRGRVMGSGGSGGSSGIGVGEEHEREESRERGEWSVDGGGGHVGRSCSSTSLARS